MLNGGGKVVPKIFLVACLFANYCDFSFLCGDSFAGSKLLMVSGSWYFQFNSFTVIPPFVEPVSQMSGREPDKAGPWTALLLDVGYPVSLLRR